MGIDHRIMSPFLCRYISTGLFHSGNRPSGWESCEATNQLVVVVVFCGSCCFNPIFDIYVDKDSPMPTCQGFVICDSSAEPMV